LSGVVSTDTTTESTTSPAPTVDRAVVRWKKLMDAAQAIEEKIVAVDLAT
jgi:hypothetical protein